MIDLHYWPTPNGKKVTILLEEAAIPYKNHPLQYRSRRPVFRRVPQENPNHRMPVMVDAHAERRRRTHRRLRVRRDHALPGREGRHASTRRTYGANTPSPNGSSGKWRTRAPSSASAATSAVSTRQAGRSVLRRSPFHR